MLAAEARRLFRPHAFHDRYRFAKLGKALASRRKREAVAFELLREPTRAETDDHTTTRDVSERGGHLGVERRIAEPGGRDEEAELDLGSDSGHRAERGPGLEDRD